MITECLNQTLIDSAVQYNIGVISFEQHQQNIEVWRELTVQRYSLPVEDQKENVVLFDMKTLNGNLSELI